ncbi:unnamed protein product [Polarella glacialis]|uniref:RCC1-like domain-containing protein n=1 Tax=Polarella glacialis TaxID=89957 RepID=A0A813ELV6_POLGL|nr:unnamed protein product [Polarella glacialis]
MEVALASLRRLSVGACGEAAVFRAAAGVPFSLEASCSSSGGTRVRADTAEGTADSDGDEVAEGGASQMQISTADASHVGAAISRTGTDGNTGAFDRDHAPSEDEEDDEDARKLSLNSGDGDEVTELYTWGRAKNYQLGFGAVAEEQPTPRLVQMPRNFVIRSISCGRFHSIAVAACGSVFSWGFSGPSNRLGLESQDGGDASAVVEPSRLPDFGPGRHHAVKAAAGLDHSLALTAAGKVLAWGSNEAGQLGVSGTPTGSGASLRRPAVLKAGPLKAHHVRDIAAGAAHSLCVVADGGVYAWGSSSFGSLGLGPTGPSGHVGVAQQLPHLRGMSVVASSSSHVSIVLAAHGDAVIFGTCAVKGAGSSASQTDDRFFLPSRVRRNEAPRRKTSDEREETEDWQRQRGGSTSSPLCSVALGSEQAFGVDKNGGLWVWPTAGPRPCFASPVQLALAAGNSARDAGSAAQFREARLGLGAVSVAAKLGTVWAVDFSANRCLWQLTRSPGSAEVWQAERSEQLAQASSVCCGPDHQAVIVTFQRTSGSLRAKEMSSSPTCARSRAASASIESLTAAQMAGPGVVQWPGVVVPWSPLLQASYNTNAEICAATLPPNRQPGTLQQLCEDKLCSTLCPRRFGLVCDVAWELNRPLLVDRAFSFLQANAALMFSRLYLPILAQLPREVLVALELATAGIVALPSEALEGLAFGNPGPWEELLADVEPEHSSADPSSADHSTAASQAKDAGHRRKRRAAAAGRTDGSRSPYITPLPGASPNGETTAVSPTMCSSAIGSPMLAPAQWGSSLLKKNGTPGVQGEAWVAVHHTRRKLSGLGGLASPSMAALRSPMIKAASPLQGRAQPPSKFAGSSSPPGSSARSPTGPQAANPDIMLTQQLPLSTFVKQARMPAGSTAAGPSKMLAAAMQSAQAQLGNPSASCASSAAGEELAAKACWAPPAALTEGQSSLREILVAECQEHRGGPSNAPVASLSRKDPRGKPVDEEKTKCSWGMDAMPSEKPKGKSVYDIQKQEAKNQEKDKADAEIQEIEAMFAALEVAEFEQVFEQLRLSDPAAEVAEAALMPCEGSKGSRRPSRAAHKGDSGKGARRAAGVAGIGADGAQGKTGRRQGREDWTSSSWSADKGNWSWGECWRSQEKHGTDRWASENHAADRIGKGSRARGGSGLKPNGKTESGGQHWKPKDAGEGNTDPDVSSQSCS